MRVLFHATAIVATATLGGLIAYGEGPACNFFTPKPQKFCKDPFTRCVHHGNATNCVSGDEPAFLIPDCVYSGFNNTHCNSYIEETECNRTLDCIWNTTYNRCDEGDVNATPTYTTAYFSDPCVPAGS